jgi:hypothetical protein
MEKIIICTCPKKPTIMTDGPLIIAISKYGHQQGFDVSKREGNTVKHGSMWHVAYYESDLELVEKPGEKHKGKR